MAEDTRKTKWATQYIPGGKGKMRIRHRDSDKYDKIVYSQDEARDYITGIDKTLKYDDKYNLIIPKKVQYLDPSTFEQKTVSDSTTAATAIAGKSKKAEATRVKTEAAKESLIFKNLNTTRNQIADLEGDITLHGSTPQKAMELELLRNRFIRFSHQAGIDTTGYGDLSAPEDKGGKLTDYIPEFLKPDEEGQWKAKRRVQYMTPGAVRDADIPAGYSKYEHVKNLVNEEWEERKESLQDPSKITITELINKQ